MDISRRGAERLRAQRMIWGCNWRLSPLSSIFILQAFCAALPATAVELAVRPDVTLNAVDWKNCFNTDISGGYPYLISEMLVHSEEVGNGERGTGNGGRYLLRFLPAKPKDWKSGSIKGLLLRGGIVLESLEWQDDDFSAILRFPDGTVKRVNGKAGTQTGIFIDGGV